jgi:DNA-binding FadR family transcriptional regulator
MLILADGDVDAEIAADQVFHQHIYNLAGSPLLSRTLTAVRELLYENIERNVRQLYDEQGYAEENRRGHQAILAAIRVKDPRRAARLARAHIDFAMDWLERIGALPRRLGSEENGCE